MLVVFRNEFRVMIIHRFIIDLGVQRHMLKLGRDQFILILNTSESKVETHIKEYCALKNLQRSVPKETLLPKIASCSFSIMFALFFTAPMPCLCNSQLKESSVLRSGRNLLLPLSIIENEAPIL